MATMGFMLAQDRTTQPSAAGARRARSQFLSHLGAQGVIRAEVRAEWRRTLQTDRRESGKRMLDELAIIFVLVLINGFFSGAEIALVALRKTRIKELADEGSTAAAAALALKEDPERFLATV